MFKGLRCLFGIFVLEIIITVIIWKLFGWWFIPIIIAGSLIIGILLAAFFKVYDFLKS